MITQVEKHTHKLSRRLFEYVSHTSKVPFCIKDGKLGSPRLAQRISLRPIVAVKNTHQNPARYTILSCSIQNKGELNNKVNQTAVRSSLNNRNQLCIFPVLQVLAQSVNRTLMVCELIGILY